MELLQHSMELVRKILLWSTATILILIILGTILLTLKIVTSSYPEPPNLIYNSTSKDNDEVANYKVLVETIQYRQTNLYEYVVIKTLLELFKSVITTLITYIFAQTGLQIFLLYRTERKWPVSSEEKSK